MVSFNDPGAIAMLFLELEGRLKEIDEQARQCVKPCEFVRSDQPFKPAIAHDPPQLHGCECLLRQALVHVMRLWLWPESKTRRQWTGDAIGFLADARRRFTPSMRQRIALHNLYANAARQVRAGDPSLAEPPPECPFTLDDLLAPNVEPSALAARLREPGQS
jgi:hypothetical protein